MKTKAIILVLLTLVIGFFLGMLTSATIRHHRMKSLRVYSSEQRFREGFYSSINPTDSQKVSIDAILNKYAAENRLLVVNFRKEMEVMMDSMKMEIEPLLTEEQLKNLRDRESEMKDMFRRSDRPMRMDTIMGKPHGPGRQGRSGGGDYSQRVVRFK